MEEKEAKEYVQGLARSIVEYRKRVGQCQKTLYDIESQLRDARKCFKIAETFYRAELERLGVKGGEG